MTFAGFDEEQIQQQLSELQQSIEEIENMTEEERRANTRTLDELWKDLEDDEPED
jgi:cytochrome c556